MLANLGRFRSETEDSRFALLFPPMHHGALCATSTRSRDVARYAPGRDGWGRAGAMT